MQLRRPARRVEQLSSCTNHRLARHSPVSWSLCSLFRHILAVLETFRSEPSSLPSKKVHFGTDFSLNFNFFLNLFFLYSSCCFLLFVFFLLSSCCFLLVVCAVVWCQTLCRLGGCFGVQNERSDKASQEACKVGVCGRLARQ